MGLRVPLWGRTLRYARRPALSVGFAPLPKATPREAWRWFGGVLVWLASVLTTGAPIGALAMAWIGGTIAARDFGEYSGLFCVSAGGQVVEQDNGSSYCAIWINRPDQ
jgi:hypothetical protein